MLVYPGMSRAQSALIPQTASVSYVIIAGYYLIFGSNSSWRPLWRKNSFSLTNDASCNKLCSLGFDSKLIFLEPDVRPNSPWDLCWTRQYVKFRTNRLIRSLFDLKAGKPSCWLRAKLFRFWRHLLFLTRKWIFIFQLLPRNIEGVV